MRFEQVEGNLMSMAQLATANGIRVVLCSVLPPVTRSWPRWRSRESRRHFSEGTTIQYRFAVTPRRCPG